MTIRINWSLFLTVTLAIIAGLCIVFALVGFLQERSQRIADEGFENRKQIGFNGDSTDTVTKPTPA